MLFHTISQRDHSTLVNSVMHMQMLCVLCSFWLSLHNEPLLAYFVHRFAPGIQMRSYLDWMMATMQLTLITRYSYLAIFQNFCILVEYPGLTSLSLSGHYLSFCTETCGCCRISRSGRKTVCFRSTRVQSGTPTVFSLCSGKTRAKQYYDIILAFH